MPRDDDKEDDAEEDDDAKGQWCKVLTMEGCFFENDTRALIIIIGANYTCIQGPNQNSGLILLNIGGKEFMTKVE